MKHILLLILAVLLPVAANAKKPRVRNKVHSEVSTPVEAKFVLGSARIMGKIEGYNSDFTFTTGQIDIENPFTREALPQVFLIAADGMFETEVPVWYAGLVEIIMGKEYFELYVEPGKALEITFVKTQPHFTGDLADVNAEINAFDRTEVSREQRQEMRDSDDWQAVQAGYRNIMDDNLLRLEQARKDGTISDKTYGILRNVELAEFTEELLRYQMDRYYADKETPVEFYAFLREMPLDDPAFIITNGRAVANYVAFIRPLAQTSDMYSSFSTSDGNNVTISIPDFLEDKGDVLSTDERWWLTVPTEEWTTDSLLKKKYACVAGNFYPRFIELAKDHELTRRFTPEVSYTRRGLDYADSAWLALTGRKPGLMMDIVALTELNNVSRKAPDLTPSDILQLHRAVYDHVEHPFLRDEVWRHYEQMIPMMGGKAIELPAGPAADILHGIIGRFKGKPVLVDFWGTSCAPCRAALERNKEQRAAVEAKGDVALAYITAPLWSPVGYERFITNNAMTNSFLITDDEWNIIAPLLKLNSVPRYVLFDEQGRILNADHSGSLSGFY